MTTPLKVWWFNDLGSYYTRLELHADGRLIIPKMAVRIAILFQSLLPICFTNFIYSSLSPCLVSCQMSQART